MVYQIDQASILPVALLGHMSHCLLRVVGPNGLRGVAGSGDRVSGDMDSGQCMAS